MSLYDQQKKKIKKIKIKLAVLQQKMYTRYHFSFGSLINFLVFHENIT